MSEEAPEVLREIDYEVSVEVFGLQVLRDGEQRWQRISPPSETSWRLLPHYSTDIAAAWQVVNHFWAVTVEKCDSVDDRYLVTITGRDGREWYGKANTAPMAICDAALEAIRDANQVTP